jgi:two-component system, NarL family, response regulator NreC
MVRDWHLISMIGEDDAFDSRYTVSRKRMAARGGERSAAGRLPSAPEGVATVRRISVAVLDDHPVVRAGMRAVLERDPEIEVVAELATLEDTVALGEDPDVVVADLVLADAPGVDFVGALRARFPRSAILVLTMLHEPGRVVAALAAGADGYMVKEAAAGALTEAVHRLRLGGRYVEPSLGAALATGAGRAGGWRAEALTEREQQILRLLVAGHTNVEIAARLGISRRTVEVHRANLVRKLGVHTRAELVRFALDHGIVHSGEPLQRDCG